MYKTTGGPSGLLGTVAPGMAEDAECGCEGCGCGAVQGGWSTEGASLFEAPPRGRETVRPTGFSWFKDATPSQLDSPAEIIEARDLSPFSPIESDLLAPSKEPRYLRRRIDQYGGLEDGSRFLESVLEPEEPENNPFDVGSHRIPCSKDDCEKLMYDRENHKAKLDRISEELRKCIEAAGEDDGLQAKCINDYHVAQMAEILAIEEIDELYDTFCGLIDQGIVADSCRRV
jgi:hypothetical protein